MTSDSTTHLLTKLLDLTAERQRVLSHNLANVNTPGFRRKDIKFEQDLGAALRQGPSGLSDFQPQVEEDAHAAVRADGNSVQFDLELAEMSKNAMLYQLAMQAMQQRISLTRTAVTGRA